MLKKLFTCAAVLMTALTLISCSEKTPSGKEYAEKSSNMENAISAVNSADSKKDELSDISYTVFYSLNYRDLTGERFLGTKNTVSVSQKGTDGVSALIEQTYIGETSSVSEVFGYKDGSAYLKMYDSDFLSEIAYSDFITFVENQRFSADGTYLDIKHFSKVTNYKLKDGSSEIVFTSPSAELHNLIVKFIGLDTSDYKYTVTDTSLTVNITSGGELTDKHLTFTVSYYDEDTPDQRVVYNGDFSYTVDKSSDVTVNMPSGYTKAQRISSISLLKRFTSGYTVLASTEDLDAIYDKAIEFKANENTYCKITQKVHLTQGYKNGKYRYGSIDERYLLTNSSESKALMGMFIHDDGKYYTRSSDGEEKNGETPPNTEDEFVEMVHATLSEEAVLIDDITGVKVTETDDTVTFTYSFKDSVIPYYAEYLISAVTADGKVDIELSDYKYIKYKNQSSITIRKSDGCVISQTVDFRVVFYELGWDIQTNFKMTVNATGSNVDILDVSDWGNHSFGE